MAASFLPHVPPQAPDRRAASRQRVMREGRLMLPEGLGPTVLIVDVSETGALIRLRAPTRLPLDMVLIDRRPAMAHRAVIARRQELEVGLRFLRSLSLHGEVPAPLAAAKAWALGSD